MLECVRRWGWVGGVVVLLMVPVAVWAQDAGGSGKGEAALPTRFDVVSIRPAVDERGGVLTVPEGTDFRATGMPLALLVQLAFGVNPNQIDVPEWAQGAKFDIVAKTGSDVALTYTQMKPLVLKMLEERFRMTYHRETRELQGYDLVVAKGGLRLTPAKPGASKGGGSNLTSITLTNTKMVQLAGMLTLILKRPVADKTDATGDYEVHLSFAREGDAESEATLPSIFTALQEQLGLKVVPAKVPVEMVVIDHLEKMPTEN